MLLGIKGPKSLGLHTLYDCGAGTVYDAMFCGNWIKCVGLGRVFGRSQNQVFVELILNNFFSLSLLQCSIRLGSHSECLNYVLHLYTSCYNMQNLLQIQRRLVIQFLLAFKPTKNIKR